MSKKANRPMRALILAGILSLAAASAAHAGGHATGGDFHNGAGAATNGQSQGQNGGHIHRDGGRGGMTGEF